VGDGELGRTPDVIVLHTSGLDGWEICDRLRERYPALPVIALTAAVRPDGANRDRARATLNCAAFVGKPCTHDDLAAVIRRVVRGDRGIEWSVGALRERNRPRVFGSE
jgi:CheY-like chemotaxis protein